VRINVSCNLFLFSNKVRYVHVTVKKAVPIGNVA
jgi:hypothetical protein